MLTTSRWRLSAGALVVMLLAALFVTSQALPAAAACFTNALGQQVCTGTGEAPGTPEVPGGSDGGETAVGFTPGPTECVYNGGDEPEVVDCSRGGGYWSNSGQCYWTLLDPQLAPPPGKDPQVGAWYECVPYEECVPGTTPGGLPISCYGGARWLDAPPPGITRYTPAQAASIIARQLVLRPITIGLAPEEKVHTDDPAGTAPYRRTWVGIPVWAWVHNPTENQFGSPSVSGTAGGVTVTVSARAQSLVWDSGDGQQKACGAGTAFDVAYWANRPAEDSPTCGWRYTQTGTFTVSATTNWVVEWTGGGESGQIQMPSTTATTQVQVGELQSVNVSSEGDTFAVGG